MTHVNEAEKGKRNMIEVKNLTKEFRKPVVNAPSRVPLKITCVLR